MPRRSKLRVIVDTNCWISFLIGKRLSRLVDLLSNERIQLVICDELGDSFQPTQHIRLCRDEADDYLLDLAIDARANYLITGDQDLLVLQEVATCRIVDVVSFEREVL